MKEATIIFPLIEGDAALGQVPRLGTSVGTYDDPKAAKAAILEDGQVYAVYEAKGNLTEHGIPKRFELVQAPKKRTHKLTTSDRAVKA